MKEKNNEKCLSVFHVDGNKYRTHLSRKYALRKPYKPYDPNKITAFIPGTIRKVNVAVGHKVRKGDVLLILEAMKMYNSVTAHNDGIVASIDVKQGDKVTKNQVLIEISQ